MKILLDTCVWGGAAATLTAAGHDVRWMGETPPDPGDAAVLGLAFDEGRVLITLDKDFGELAIVYGKPHCGIIRLVDLPARQQGSYCVTVLERFADELTRGAILTVTSQRVRIRPAD
jgi:predicted nuclease of predicted toxin-antitoxin system